jgi:ligand-binding sensor domain-containing protein
MRISQYAHTAWHMQDGVFGGAPPAINKTVDGYIWIGTDAGLVRFDGVRFTPGDPPPDKRSAISGVFALLGSRDGTLWIGSASGLTALKNDRLIDFSNARGRINSILEDHAGIVWVPRSRAPDRDGGICQVLGEKLRYFGNSDGMALPNAGPLAADSRGNLWIGSRMNCYAGHPNRGTRISGRS